MTAMLGQAITLVKSGQRREARSLLLEILKTDPENEQAWLWLSGVVGKEKQIYCLEKVLSINPNNQTARKALVRLQIWDNEADTPPQSSTPVPSAPLRPQIWYSKDGNKGNITVLLPDRFITGFTTPFQAQRLEADFQQEGQLPANSLMSQKEIPLRQITSVHEILGKVRLFYTQDNQPRTIGLNLPDNAAAHTIIAQLEQQLGLERKTSDASLATVIGVPSVGMLVTACFTYIFYNVALEMAAGETMSGSARTRAMANLVGLIGPTGVLIIGGLIFLLAFGLLIFWLMRPPQKTELVPSTTPRTS